jgi:hypothetical protein
MRKMRLFKFLALGAFCLVAFFAFKWAISFFSKRAPGGQPIPFAWVSVVHFSSGDLPCFNIEIEGQKFPVMLDLGFSGEVSLSKECVSSIKDKTFFLTKEMSNWRGNSYPTSWYQIPKFQLETVTLRNPLLKEENPLLKQQSVVWDDAKDLTQYVGKLGWKLFQKLTLFLDFKHGTMAICDNVDTFAQYGYKLERFVKVPALISEDAVEVDVSTPDGFLRCLLDTGCTYSCWNDDYPVEEVRKRMEGARYFKTFSNVYIGGKDFGKMVFRPIPLKLDPPVQAILGMDFFFEHQVLIDFKNEQIYIAVSKEEDKPDGPQVRFD